MLRSIVLILCLLPSYGYAEKETVLPDTDSRLLMAYYDDPSIHAVRDKLLNSLYRPHAVEKVDLGGRVCGVAGCSFSYLLVERFSLAGKMPGISEQKILTVVSGILSPFRVTSVRQVRLETVNSQIITPVE